MRALRQLSGGAVLAAGLLLGGCSRSVPPGSIVLTQTPPPATPSARDLLETRYPPGSRIVLASPPFDPNRVRVLSQGLFAAGSPVVSIDAQRIVFVGKADANTPWQIYEVNPRGGRPRRLTSVPGGALDPAFIAHGDLVFASPVPPATPTAAPHQPATALYVRDRSGATRRLTFSPEAASDPTVLADGRILFVTRQPAPPGAPPRQALFTISNDGTEFTAFAAQHDGAPFLRRPRALTGGLVGFLSANALADSDTWAESVRLARPQQTRAKLFQFSAGDCRSIEPTDTDAVLASLPAALAGDPAGKSSYAIFRVVPDSRSPGPPLFDAPTWDDVEATFVTPRPNPMGHLSAMNPAHPYGTILCLDINRTAEPGPDGAPPPAARRVRVLAAPSPGQTTVLGELPVQSDGSFLIQVPTDVPLGFEALDEANRVVRRLPPSVWVRAGENRTCLGCHEPHNRSPRNQRPRATAAPPVDLTRGFAPGAPHSSRAP